MTRSKYHTTLEFWPEKEVRKLENEVVKIQWLTSKQNKQEADDRIYHTGKMGEIEWSEQ